MFTSNYGFVHCGQASRQAYSTGPQKATIYSVTQQEKSQNQGNATILLQLNESGHVNRLSVTENHKQRWK